MPHTERHPPKCLPQCPLFRPADGNHTQTQTWRHNLALIALQITKASSNLNMALALTPLALQKSNHTKPPIHGSSHQRYLNKLNFNTLSSSRTCCPAEGKDCTAGCRRPGAGGRHGPAERTTERCQILTRWMRLDTLYSGSLEGLLGATWFSGFSPLLSLIALNAVRVQWLSPATWMCLVLAMPRQCLCLLAHHSDSPHICENAMAYVHNNLIAQVKEDTRCQWTQAFH